MSRRSNRELVPTKIYTPSNSNQTTRNYVLNEKRTLNKIKEAANRDIDIQATLKRGNLFIQFSLNQSLKLTVNERFDLSKKLSERSISFADVNNPSKQLYRVNISNTTCRIEVNGKQSMSFIDELSKIASQMSNDVDYKHLNTKIKEQCDILLSSINNDHNSSVVNNTMINPSKAVTSVGSNDIKNPE
ncbi:unnamed protein product [Mytilus edulis]|uniref:Uncharacterized protein n=1 Tax=Mytilus edulis TaxID=6550 RepID=A0A8S3S7X7_MYTED|nr:unnamed protein product [Mytilus edulis]